MEIKVLRFVAIIVFIRLTDASIYIFATEGDNVTIPCNVQPVNQGDNIQWKYGTSYNGSHELAFHVDEHFNCVLELKSCSIVPINGSLILYNVGKTDSAAYYCSRGTDGRYTYYSEHHLEVREANNEPKFSYIPNLADIDMYFQSNSTAVISYPNPTCSDKEDGTHVVVWCNPPPGSHVSTDTSQIVCTCTDSTQLSVQHIIKMKVENEAPVFKDESDPVVTVYMQHKYFAVLSYLIPNCIDHEDGTHVVVRCNPPPGSRVSTDTSEVICTCTDSAQLSVQHIINIKGTIRIYERKGLWILVGIACTVPFFWLIALKLINFRLGYIKRGKKEKTTSEKEKTTGENQMTAVQPTDDVENPSDQQIRHTTGSDDSAQSSLCATKGRSNSRNEAPAAEPLIHQEARNVSAVPRKSRISADTPTSMNNTTKRSTSHQPPSSAKSFTAYESDQSFTGASTLKSENAVDESDVSVEHRSDYKTGNKEGSEVEREVIALRGPKGFKGCISFTIEEYGLRLTLCPDEAAKRTLELYFSKNEKVYLVHDGKSIANYPYETKK